MNGTDYKNLKERCDQVGKMLNGLIHSLKTAGGKQNE